MKRAGVSGFWELAGTSRFLPRETREYVPMILAAIIVGRNPAQYGFIIEPADPVAFERMTVPAATDLRRLAEWIGAPVTLLQTLNPELRRFTTPLRTTDYEIKVPAGAAGLIAERIASAPPNDLADLRWHTVKRGETLSALAQRFKVSRTELAEANQLSARARLRIGQELVIPRAPGPLVSARNLRATPAAPRDVVARASVASSSTTYTVRKGDTLYGIARRFGLSVQALKTLNRLRAIRILPGDRLTISADRTTSTQ
jgi:membrane-bound lytic murein transglycosylase D